jgi:hypothetical protein
VDREVERHAELHAAPGGGVAAVAVLERQHDRLAVDVLDRGHRPGHGRGADAHGDRQRHRRQHVGGVVLAGHRLVAHDRPAGGLDQLDVEALARVVAHRAGHDDRRGAGDRDEADAQALLLGRAGRLREGLGGGGEGKNLRQRGHRGGGAHAGQQAPSRGAAAEHGARHRGLDHTCGHVLGRSGAGRRREALAAAAARAGAGRRHGIVEQPGHRVLPGSRRSSRTSRRDPART